MGANLVTAVAGTGRVVAGHLWLILVAGVVPAVLACVTSVILVLSVERSQRVEAIKAMPPVVTALNRLCTMGTPTQDQRNEGGTSPTPRDTLAGRS